MSAPVPASTDESKEIELLPPSISVHFKCLPIRADADDLKKLLASLGFQVQSTRIIYDHTTGLSKCYGFALFHTLEHAQSFIDRFFPSIPWKYPDGSAPKGSNFIIKVNYSLNRNIVKNNERKSMETPNNQLTKNLHIVKTVDTANPSKVTTSSSSSPTLIRLRLSSAKIREVNIQEVNTAEMTTSVSGNDEFLDLDPTKFIFGRTCFLCQSKMKLLETPEEHMQSEAHKMKSQCEFYRSQFQIFNDQLKSDPVPIHYIIAEAKAQSGQKCGHGGPRTTQAIHDVQKDDDSSSPPLMKRGRGRPKKITQDGNAVKKRRPKESAEGGNAVKKPRPSESAGTISRSAGEVSQGTS